jgi:hypothetical protein
VGNRMSERSPQDFNPQPDPPGAAPPADSDTNLNPQPEPPGAAAPDAT